MGLLEWLRPDPEVASASPLRCPCHSDPAAVEVDEVATEPANATYLCRCPACGQYWGGHAYTPQYRWELTPEEAAGIFPHAFNQGGTDMPNRSHAPPDLRKNKKTETA